jgi:hypothetical protein
MVRLFFVSISLMLCYSPNTGDIYVGKTAFWTVYYDHNREAPVVEIGGIKYGNLVWLSKGQSNDGIVAQNQQGTLYFKRGSLYYKDDGLKINTMLVKRKYTKEIEYHRFKIYEINAFSEALSVHYETDSVFHSTVKADYEFYRDNRSLPLNYMPAYKKILLRGTDR